MAELRSPRPLRAVRASHRPGSGAPRAALAKYDGAGDTTTRPGQALTYDEVGDLATVTTGAGSQRRASIAPGAGACCSSSIRHPVCRYLGDTVLHQAPGGVVSGVRTYTAANSVPVAERAGTAGRVTTSLSWLFTDVDGTVDAQADATTGATVLQWRDPFGNPLGGGSGVWSDGNGFLNKPATTDTGLTI